MCACVCVRVDVCVWERESMWDVIIVDYFEITPPACACVFAWICVHPVKRNLFLWNETQRDTHIFCMNVCERMLVCVRECVDVYVYAWETVCESMCVQERERVCCCICQLRRLCLHKCVWVCVSECACVRIFLRMYKTVCMSKCLNVCVLVKSVIVRECARERVCDVLHLSVASHPPPVSFPLYESLALLHPPPSLTPQ